MVSQPLYPDLVAQDRVTALSWPVVSQQADTDTLPTKEGSPHTGMSRSLYFLVYHVGGVIGLLSTASQLDPEDLASRPSATLG